MKIIYFVITLLLVSPTLATAGNHCSKGEKKISCRGVSGKKRAFFCSKASSPSQATVAQSCKQAKGQKQTKAKNKPMKKKAKAAKPKKAGDAALARKSKKAKKRAN